ncbi:MULTISPECIES: alpha/beta fold hydrolase [unclassified Rhodococcus (in: high G+C Gram-positive bacteria)]|uniref:alpha/beta fold hydrolase n=1 Tax=unclassified Rhodococcus (in: high G+C Gram-positive bacteria) TaxID=192944 RepID=UPI00211B3004|nr:MULTISPECIES: alpha/beta hydrolase [unclassified Rhodococcus (in: high G+C Gram-positive bacteria)]
MSNAPADVPVSGCTLWTSRGGVALHVRGSGEPVLLLHGIGSTAQSCAELAQQLSALGWRTYCWDAPGYGESADPTSELVDHTQVVLDLLDELELDTVHLFGSSWGGVIAMETALRSPDRVASLTVADSTRGSGVTPDKARAMRARVNELRTEGSESFAARRAPRLVSPSATTQVLRAVETEMSRVRVAGYLPAVEYMATHDLGPQLHRLDAPTLVLVGEDDIVTGVPESLLLSRAIPDARFGLVVGAGHAAVHERPDVLAVHMTDFLTEHTVVAAANRDRSR